MSTRRSTHNRSHMEPTVIVNIEDIRAVLHSDLSGVNLGVVDRLRDAIANEPGSAGAALGSNHDRPCTCGGRTTSAGIVHFTDCPCHGVPDDHDACRAYGSELLAIIARGNG